MCASAKLYQQLVAVPVEKPNQFESWGQVDTIT